nr:transposase [Streptomyces griseofuscus]
MPTSTLQGHGKGGPAEPADHGLGRSRGGLTTKLHLAVEQRQKPMSIVIAAGQRGDSPQFEAVLGRVRVPRLGPGRPRTRPRRFRADKAYASRKKRGLSRRPAAEVRPGRLPRAPCGGMRHQSPQEAPSGCRSQSSPGASAARGRCSPARAGSSS